MTWSLPLLFLFPFFAAITVALLGRLAALQLKRVALLFSFAPLILFALGGNGWLKSPIDLSWVATLGIRFHLAVDELSWLFIALTVVVIPISIAATSVKTLSMPSLYFSLLLALEGLLIGFFSSRDLFLFTLLWEAMLLPLYFIIAIWGGSEGKATALKFLLYMIAGSTLMVASILGIHFLQGAEGGQGSFDFDTIAKALTSRPPPQWIAALFFLAFAVKAPLFPFHGWLPSTYTIAPTGGSILLAALLSKAGLYGFFRIGLQFFPTALMDWSFLFIALATVGVLYAAFAAWGATDLKRAIAYSSLSHVNFALIGIFVVTKMGVTASLLQAVNHGITITALFLVIGWLQERVGHLNLNYYSGVAQSMPRLCWITLLFVLSAVGLPGLNNFIGEWLTFVALFSYSTIATAILITTVIFTAIYLLRWMERIFFGSEEIKRADRDIGAKELAIAIPLIAIIVSIGLYPAPLLEKIEPFAERASRSVAQEITT